MKNLKLKLNYIFLRFVLVSIGFITCYLFFYWLLFVWAQIEFRYSETVISLCTFLIPIIPAAFILYPSLKLILIRDLNNQVIFLGITSFTMAVPCFIGQLYLEKALGKTIKTESINQLEKSSNFKFLTLQNYYLDQEHFSSYKTYSIGGKHNQDLDLEVYFGIPILEKANDTNLNTCKAYISYPYFKTISSDISASTFDEELNTFYNESLADFQITDFNNFVYLEKIESYRPDYLIASNDIKYQAIDPIFFTANYTPFETRTGELLKIIIVSYLIGATLWFIIILFLKINLINYRRLIKGQSLKQTP
jgi:rhomboid protease GluP